jgi:hypothetical protein
MSSELEEMRKENEEMKRRNEKLKREVEIRKNLPINTRNNWDIATEYPEIPNTSRFIIRNYEQKYKGREDDDVEIDDDDVIRASNGRYFTREEVSRFIEKSTERCPTYGLCGECLDVGPVGMLCQRCGDRD